MKKKLVNIGVIVLVVLGFVLVVSSVRQPRTITVYPNSDYATQYARERALATEYSSGPRALETVPTSAAYWIQVDSENWINADCRHDTVECDESLIAIYEAGQVNTDVSFVVECDGCGIIENYTGYALATVTASSTEYPTVTATPTPTGTGDIEVKITIENIDPTRGLYVRNFPTLYGIDTQTAYFVRPHCDYLAASWCTQKSIPVYEVRYRAGPLYDRGWWGAIVCKSGECLNDVEYWIPLCTLDPRDDESYRCFTDWMMP